jgi:hypothetical protein
VLDVTAKITTLKDVTAIDDDDELQEVENSTPYHTVD